MTGLSSLAASLKWDITAGDGIVTGGSSTWDTVSPFWTADGGQTNVAWNNANNDEAVFGDPAGSVTVGEPITAGALTFNSSGYTLAGNSITLAGAAPAITLTPGSTTTISSILAGSSGVTIAGGGSLTLTSANTYTGGTTVNAGTLTLGVGGGTGTIRGVLNINPGATVVTNAVDALGFTNGVAVDTVNINGGTLNNATTGNQAFITNFVLTGGTMSSTGGGAYNFNTGFGITTNSSATTSLIAANMVIRAGTLTFTTASGTTPNGIDLSVTGVISGGANGILKAGPGTMGIGANTTYTGPTTVNAGVLDLTAGGGATGVIRGTTTVNSGATLRLSTADALGFTTRVTVLNLNSGTVNVNTTGNQTFAGMTLTMNAGTITGIPGSNIDLFNNGTSIVTTAAANSSVISVATMGLRQNDTVFNIADGAAPVDLLISGRLINNSGTNNQGNHNLIKNGAGTMQLTGANSYTGTTLVNAGTLALAGAGSLASPSITVASGALLDVSALNAETFTLAPGQTLIAGRASGAGNDVVGNLATGGGSLNVAGSSIAGTLTLGGTGAGSLTLHGGTVNFDLSNVPTAGAGVNDLVNVVNLTLTGTTNIAINKLNGVLNTNTYTLFKYTGALSGDSSNLTLTGAAGGTTRQNFALDTASLPGSVLLNVTGNSADLVWKGDGVANVWDVVTTANFLNGQTPDKFFDGDNVTFDDNGSNTPPIQIVGNVSPGVLTVNNTTKDYTFTGGSINGGTGLTKNGSGSLTLSNSNGFTGPVAVNAGTVSVDALTNGGTNSALGAGTAVTLGDATHSGKLQLTAAGIAMASNRALTVNVGGGTLEITDPGSTLTESGAVVLNGPLTKSGNGALTLASALSGPGSLSINGGTVTVTTFSSYTGDLNVNAGTFNTGVGAANGVTTSLGAGNGARNVTIGSGALMNWTSNNILVGGGGNAANLPTITINGGTLSSTRYNAIGNVVLNSGATLTQSASDTGNYEGFQFIGTVTSGGTAPSTITSSNGKADHLKGAATTVFNVGDATGDANPDLTISTIIRDGSGDYPGVGSLQKIGAGTLLLTSPNTYTGATTVNAGTLVLSNTSSLASTALNVGNGGKLDVSALGTYTVNPGVTVTISPGGQEVGDLALSSGAILIAGRPSAPAADLIGALNSFGTINVGGTAAAGTLTLGGTGNLALGGGAINYDLSNTATVGGGVNDLLAVGGNLDLSGLTTISVNPLIGLLSNGSYTLLTYTGNLTGTVSNLSLAGVVNGARQSFALDLSTPKALILQVTGFVNSLTWVGNGVGNQWDQTTPNWSGSANGRYLDGDSVTFDDSGSNVPSVQIPNLVQPSAVAVNNNIKNYTFSGLGQIDGPTGLVKSGGGTLTIETINSFTGAVAINQGTISVGSVDSRGVFGPLGAGTDISLGDATHQGTLQYSAVGGFSSTDRTLTLKAGGGVLDVSDPGANLTVISPIVGTGSLTKTGSGTLILGALETYTGDTIVNGGTLALTVGGIAGTVGGTLTINPGATVLSQIKDSLGYGGARATTININGGTLSHTAASNLSVWGMTVNLTGGTLQATDAGGQLDFGTDTNAGNVPTAINTLASADSSTVGGNRVNLRQAATTFNVADGAASTDLLLSAPVVEGIVGAGLVKSGAGTMAMSGISTYTGPTTVNAGTLLVTGSISGSALSVKNGAALQGDGITGALSAENGAVIAPGNTVGTLHTGNLTMASGSTLKLEINSPVPATGYDQVGVTGAADITGATLSLGGTYLAALGGNPDLFFVLLNDNLDTIVGTFNGLAEGSHILSSSGQDFRITYNADFDTSSFTGGNDIALMAVPEPAVTTVLCSGLGLLLGLRRRRR